MMLTLLESARARLGLREGAVVSGMAHAALVAAAVVATSPLTPAEQRAVAEQVRFLIPLDRVLGSRDHSRAKPMQWLTNGAGGGNQGVLVRRIERASPVEADAAGSGPDEGTRQPPVVAVQESPSTDTVLTELEVDSTVVRYPESAAPAYPRAMLSKSVEGAVKAQFVVDTLGLVDTTSFQPVASSHAEFTAAVRAALPGMRFHPAIAHSRKVRQLVEQVFTFKLLAANRPSGRDSSRAGPSDASLKKPLD